jgi:hypothetical protein
MDGPGNKPTGAGNCWVLETPGFQHSWFLLSIVARLFRNLDRADDFGSLVRYNEEACRRALAFTSGVLSVLMLLQLRSLVDLF